MSGKAPANRSAMRLSERSGPGSGQGSPSRVVEGGLALGHREPALVERLAGDHAGQVELAQTGQRPQVLQLPDPARVQEPATHRVRDAADALEVGSGELAVAGD